MKGVKGAEKTSVFFVQNIYKFQWKDLYLLDEMY